MSLPYDISRCATACGEACPLRSSCARWIDPGREGHQSFSDFPGGKGCNGYIDVRERY